MKIVILLMTAAAVSCSNLNNPMLQRPADGMPNGMEFCNQGRIKKLCHKVSLFHTATAKRPVALTFCPGTLKKLCPIKPVALQFSSGPVTSIPVGWKICRDNLGLCPVSGYGSSRRRPSITRHSFGTESRFGRPGSKTPITTGFVENRVMTHNKGMVPCKDRMGMCKPEREIVFPESRPISHNKGMVPCKYSMGMCPPDN